MLPAVTGQPTPSRPLAFQDREGVLGTSAAYDVVYHRIYDALAGRDGKARVARGT
jgi:hypothetical protein